MNYNANKKIYKLALGEDNDEVIVGNKANPSVFEADVKFTRWNKEDYLCVAYENFNGVEVLLDNKISLSKNNEEVQLYQIDKKNFEFKIILKSKPSKNTWSLKLTDNNKLNYWYQPPLTQADIDGGAFRQENMIGGYAVFHKYKRDHIKGKTNYKCGQAFLIYRPKAFDADGKEVWCRYNTDLHKINILTITVPQSFLDTAKYPITIDPIFGSQDEQTTHQLVENAVAGCQFTMGGTAGTATSITYFVYGGHSFYKFYNRGVIYLHSDLSLIGAGVEAEKITADDEWITSNMGNEELLADTDYVLACWGSPTAIYNCSIHYTTAGPYTDWGHIDAAMTYHSTNDPETPLDAVHEDRLYAIYCTYEEVAGDVTISPPVADVKIEGQAATISTVRNASITAVVAEIKIEGQAPVISVATHATITAIVADVQIEGITPTISTTKNPTITGVAADVDILGQAPTIVAVRNISVTSTVGEIKVEPQTPTVISEQSIVITASVTDVNILGLAPAITAEIMAQIVAPIVLQSLMEVMLLYNSRITQLILSKSRVQQRLLYKSEMDLSETKKSRISKRILEESTIIND